MLAVPPPEVAAAEARLDVLPPERTRILLVPEAGMPIKQWPVASWQELSARLTADGAALVVPTASDPQLAAAVVAESAPAVVVEPLPLLSVAALAARCDAAVAVDTGLARMASAVGTPVVCLFGPSPAGRFGLRPPSRNLASPLPCDIRDPLDMVDQACWYSGVCAVPGLPTCTATIAVADVHDAVRGLLSTTRRQPAA